MLNRQASFDYAGRLAEAHTGEQARGGSVKKAIDQSGSYTPRVL